MTRWPTRRSRRRPWSTRPSVDCSVGPERRDLPTYPCPVTLTASTSTQLDAVAALLERGNVLVLTGAGISTDSGIPDYRGPDGTRRVTPMQFAEFVGSSQARQRYWARSYVGWQRFNLAKPNSGHEAVA